MHPVALVELQRAGDPVEDLLGDATHVAAFESDVVLGADPREQRDLFAAQSLDAPVAAVGGQTGLLGGDPRPPRGEELADVVPRVHGFTLRPSARTEGVPASTCLNRVSHEACATGLLGSEKEAVSQRRNPMSLQNDGYTFVLSEEVTRTRSAALSSSRDGHGTEPRQGDFVVSDATTLAGERVVVVCHCNVLLSGPAPPGRRPTPRPRRRLARRTRGPRRPPPAPPHPPRGRRRCCRCRRRS